MALPKRGITKETSELFGYGIAEYRRQPVQVATYKDQKGNDVAQHIRFQDKKFIWIVICQRYSYGVNIYGDNMEVTVLYF